MRNVQIIDGAENCTFSIFQAMEDKFRSLFPDTGQDIEFAEDFFERVGEAEGTRILDLIWERPAEKRYAHGVHGTLFYGFADRRRCFPASKRERDWHPDFINEAQRRLYGRGV